MAETNHIQGRVNPDKGTDEPKKSEDLLNKEGAAFGLQLNAIFNAAIEGSTSEADITTGKTEKKAPKQGTSGDAFLRNQLAMTPGQRESKERAQESAKKNTIQGRNQAIKDGDF
jgi:hypothetical protein